MYTGLSNIFVFIEYLLIFKKFEPFVKQKRIMLLLFHEGLRIDAVGWRDVKMWIVCFAKEYACKMRAWQCPFTDFVLLETLSRHCSTTRF